MICPSLNLIVIFGFPYFRRKSRWELTRISAAVMGIEFSYAAETAFVSPTLLKIGKSLFNESVSRVGNYENRFILAAYVYIGRSIHSVA
jgi:hypothetical protein